MGATPSSSAAAAATATTGTSPTAATSPTMSAARKLPMAKEPSSPQLRPQSREGSTTPPSAPQLRKHPIKLDSPASSYDSFVSALAQFRPPSMKNLNSNVGPDLKAGLSSARRAEDFDAEYVEGDVLGEGITGTVRRVTHRKSGKEYAMKVVNLSRINKAQVKELRQEVAVLKKLDHPNVVRLIETFEDGRSIRLVMELCTGGELAKRRLRKEFEVVSVVAQLLSAIVHCHNVGVIHRDLKLENVLFASPDPDSRVKIIDFGLSNMNILKRLRAAAASRSNNKAALDRVVATTCGTSFYMAPEVLDGRYDAKCDVWSAGVITYMLLTGKPPFDGADEKTIFKKIRAGVVDFSAPVWTKLSPHALELVRNLLVVHPEQRWSADAALQSAWFSRYHAEIQAQAGAEIDGTVMDALTRFVSYGRMKKAALMVVAHHSNHAQLADLRMAFLAIDTDNSGAITLEELRKVLVRNGLAESQADEVFRSVDVDSSGEIQYSEWLAATVEARCVVDREKLTEAFERIADGGKVITRVHLSKLLGQGLSKKQAKAIIAELDENGDGVIDLDEFLSLVERREDSISQGTGFYEAEADEADIAGSLAVPSVTVG